MKKPAWTTPLFLQVNKLVGRWSIIDQLMVLSAHYLLFILLGVLMYQWWKMDVFFVQLLVFAVIFAGSLGVSYSVAVVWRRPRPIHQLLGIKILIQTMGTWKSFPSDHTIGATIVGYGAFLIFSGWQLVIFLFFAAIVAFSRVWVGVHYPRDIVGGFLVASGVILLTYFF
jgi:undecaprenyl-diphosphatase